MPPKRSISTGPDPYAARPPGTIGDPTLQAEDNLARPRRVAQFRPGRYTIFAPPSDSEDGYEFYGESVGHQSSATDRYISDSWSLQDFEKDDGSDFEPAKRPVKTLCGQFGLEEEGVTDMVNFPKHET